MAILEFRGRYRFLSNFFPAEIHMDGMRFPTVEHAYQAAKTHDFRVREDILNASRPGRAKELGRSISLRPDWEDIKVTLMMQLLRQKFQHPHLARLLLATGDQLLVEGNYWNDRFWGVCRGEGKNMLGQLLMEVRKELAEEERRR